MVTYLFLLICCDRALPSLNRQKSSTYIYAVGRSFPDLWPGGRLKMSQTSKLCNLFNKCVNLYNLDLGNDLKNVGL